MLDAERPSTSCASASADVRADALGSALYLDAQLGSRTTCSTTSTAPRWPTRSRCGSRSSTTTSSSCARDPVGVQAPPLQTTKHVLKIAARGLIPTGSSTSRRSASSIASVEGWFRAQTDGAVSDYLLDPGARVHELLDRRALESLVARTATTADVRRALDAHARVWLLDLPAARGRELRRRRRDLRDCDAGPERGRLSADARRLPRRADRASGALGRRRERLDGRDPEVLRSWPACSVPRCPRVDATGRPVRGAHIVRAFESALPTLDPAT